MSNLPNVFDGQIERIFVYQIPSSYTPLPENWQRVETDLPLSRSAMHYGKKIYINKK